MQKLWFGLFGLIITTGAFAADLCVRNDAMVVALNPDFGGTAVASNDTGVKTWSTRFSYGTISGIAACATDCTSQGCVATNQNLNPSVFAGGNCYCKMLHPVESPWVYLGHKNYGNGYGSNDSGCLARCALYCASGVASSEALRRGLFRSINMSD